MRHGQQTLRDRIHRYNEAGRYGLADRARSGLPGQPELGRTGRGCKLG